MVKNQLIALLLMAVSSLMYAADDTLPTTPLECSRELWKQACNVVACIQQPRIISFSHGFALAQGALLGRMKKCPRNAQGAIAISPTYSVIMRKLAQSTQEIENSTDDVKQLAAREAAMASVVQCYAQKILQQDPSLLLGEEDALKEEIKKLSPKCNPWGLSFESLRTAHHM